MDWFAPRDRVYYKDAGEDDTGTVERVSNTGGDIRYQVRFDKGESNVDEYGGEQLGRRGH